MTTLTHTRMGSRTKEQFIQDILVGNQREQRAVELFNEFLQKQYGFKGQIVENGVDMSGAYIEDDSKISLAADYLVGFNKLPMEVKTSTAHSITIYLKCYQVDSYIRQGAALLFVNGIERRTPAFTFFSVEDLKKIRRNCKKEIPPRNINGGIESFVLEATELTWLQFNGEERVYAKF